MAEYKKQHVIAKNYLKGFSSVDYYKDNKENCPIWFYNLEDKTLKYKSPTNVAWRPYYYSAIDNDGERQHFLEKDFSKLETLVNILSKKIDFNIHCIRKQYEITPLTHDDRLLLVHFIYWHMKKVPSVVDRIYDGVKDIYTELAQKYNNTFTDAEIKNETLKIMLEIGNGEEFDFVKVLLQKDFRIVFLPNDKSSFITTDNPVNRFNKVETDGIGIDSTEIYFPFNQRSMLFLYGKGNKYEYLRYSDRKHLYQLNKFVASKAKYFIVARDKEYLVKILNDLKYEISL